ncbi:MAG TPA: hypothetical protein VLE43_03145 [Candidatus Saccharimonadia bacterium]|nr:hypothetical protein [Candidatus Saccharimonadia bacterium]
MSPQPPVRAVDYRALSCALFCICLKLPDGFSLQDVIDRVMLDAPELLDELPHSWAHLRAEERVRNFGIDGSRYKISIHYRDELAQQSS